MYTALIVEPRNHPCLPIVLENFDRNLSDEWSFLIFHGSDNKSFIETIIKNKSIKRSCTFVDLKVNNMTIKEYNQLFYSFSFYNFIPTETFLVFQTDSLISPVYKNKINKFLQYDYVGAPLRIGKGKVGNGGLSLRKKSKMIELLQTNFSDEVYLTNEDLFFAGLRFNNINKVPIFLPNPNKAKEFSVESMMYDKPFGVHKPWKHINKKNMNILKKSFPQLDNLTKTWINYENINKKEKIKKKFPKPSRPKIPNIHSYINHIPFPKNKFQSLLLKKKQLPKQHFIKNNYSLKAKKIHLPNSQKLFQTKKYLLKMRKPKLPSNFFFFLR